MYCLPLKIENEVKYIFDDSVVLKNTFKKILKFALRIYLKSEPNEEDYNLCELKESVPKETLSTECCKLYYNQKELGNIHYENQSFLEFSPTFSK